jgi:hypothetical protein
MNAIAFRSLVAVLLVVPLALADETKLDIRSGVPADAYLAVYAEHNPERDYQHEYAKQIWQTIEDEKLPERIVKLVMDQLRGEERETASSISDELQTISETTDWSQLAKSPELAYGQVMDVPQTHHVVIVRLPSADAAARCETALKQLGEMIERRSEGAVDAALDDSGEVRLYTLSVPKVKEFPFQPTFTRIDDVLILSTSAKVLGQSVDSLLHGGVTKFDDPRLQSALEKLPEPEDALVFYDGRHQFRTMRGIGLFVRDKAGKDANAVRFAGLFERTVDERAILDYEATVEYTDGNRNLKTAIGQLVPDADDKLLYRVCAQGQPFEDWQHWVPSDAQAFSLVTGANLHALYEWIVNFLSQEIPEAKPALEKFEQAQDEWGVHLDRDILQAFNGECVSLKLPATSPGTVGGQDTVFALRCHKPDRIRELLHDLVERLAKNPYVAAQQLKLVPAKDLEGFDELSLTTLTMFGVRPVIGFHEGWMMVGSNASAVRKVLRTLSGEEPSIDTSEQFKRFGLEIEGPVYAISYKDLAAGTRQFAQFVRQAGITAPMIVGMAGAKTDPEKMKPLQEAFALLPSVANVIDKFDYLEARVSIVQAGENPGSYVKRTVTMVRPPEQKSTVDDSAQNAQ